MKLTRRAALGAFGAAVVTACSPGERARYLYSSDHHPADYPTVLAVKELGRLLSERTDGRLAIKVFPGGQLGSEADTLEITIFGGLDINRVNAAPLNSIAPLTTPLCLPFVFRDEKHLRCVLDGSPGKKVLASLEDYGLIGLCFYDSGARSFYNTKRPILTPDDMRGMKLRVPNSDLYVGMVRALGGNATPMSLAEVYQSLVQGVIDGAENNWPSYESGRHFEVATHYSLTNHMMTPEILVMSRDRWQLLSPADRDLLLQTAAESVGYMRKLWDERVAASRETLLKSGIKVNEVTDTSEFALMVRPVWNQYAGSKAQRALVEEIQSMSGECV